MKKMSFIILTMLLLVGCSTSKGADSVRLVLDWAPNTNHTGLYVALDQGYFDDIGIDFEIVQPPEDGAPGLVASGGAQFGIGFQDSLAPLFAKESPLPITAVAGIVQHNTSGLVSLKEKGIDRPSKLANHRYATWDSPVEKAMIEYIVSKDGGDFNAVTLIPSTVADAVSALQTNIDAIWIFRAWDGIALDEAGLETNYLNFSDYAPEFDYYSPVIIANNDYLEANPEQAKKVMSAIKKGYEFASENPIEAGDILIKHVPELRGKESFIHASQQWLAPQYQADAQQWGLIDEARWNRFYTWLAQQNLIDRPIAEGFGFTNQFITE